MNSLRTSFSRQSDLALVFGVLGILLVLFSPIPAAALDLLIILNFALGMTILLLTFYVEKPVEFSTFPSLLLIATLFRLSLNIAATRLILSHGEAGKVIGAVGSYVVQGNFVIGLVVFFILIVVQYVVVTNGAQRVSEVAARFALDAMPGQQMSIDADLNMGLIDQDEAKRRRKALEREAGFYGSMDGASKFVKGDAIAGIVILLIDILGGWSVGVAQLNMSWMEALQTFTLLTIGDGIVTQVPALIISVATGIIVTRSASDTQLSAEVLKQLIRYPKIQMLVLCALTGLLALPGMPKWPILGLVLLCGIAFFLARRRAKSFSDEVIAEGENQPHTVVPEPVSGPVVLELSAELEAAWTPTAEIVGNRTSALRAQVATDLGFLIPVVSIRTNPALTGASYQILFHGSRFGTATLHPARKLAITGANSSQTLVGIPTKDPAFGLPAVWVEPADELVAKANNCTLVDPLTVTITHINELVRSNAMMLLGRAETMRLLEGVRQRQPGLIEELVPTVLAASDVQKVLQNLLSESVSIENIDLIIEVLADEGRQQKDTLLLTEAVRQRLGFAICERLMGDGRVLSVMTIDPQLELSMSQSLRSGEPSSVALLDHKSGERFLTRLMSSTEAVMRQNAMPVLLCGPELRRHIKSFTRRMVPRLSVISVSEIPHSVELKAVSLITI
ncbi:flagellar biosynthesis protein FlhA (plasmid) [Burkholderia ubonensis]|uniref:Flagellar biosynthesis protein FlhA n=1 Tax=Burkholderia ubonensis TaxID=101571 RepID=A0A124RCK0_9BURK|nr:flagellar biosynthesis protein FlhA [Burkholderia ubonensis]AOJ64572.1 flagellar biosynthesis protein FlhA [Burkholderia ubonensis]KVG71116.1 flagellar biosynthesis protein FlhA [Burkholderia ubonensis]